jgi:phosphoenolpyruvate---glycerone phosphotransferase subunit DhaL
MNTLKKENILEILLHLKNLMNDKKDYLVELDSKMGDGDLGLTMAKGFSAAYDQMIDPEESDLGVILSKAGMVIAKTAPSTMGTLMGTGFMRGGKALKGKTELGTADLALFFKDFVQGLMDRGKARPGDKTIIDSIKPAADALESAAGQGLKPALDAALEAAKKGLEATKEMVAQHGRIAYYKDKSLGHQDPGATVGVFILQVFAEYIG